MSGRNVIIVAGNSGSGKSTASNRYLINADLAVLFLYDPFPGEFNSNLGEFADRLKIEPAEDLFGLNVALCRGRVAFDPHTMFPGQLQEGFKWFCKWAWECSLQIPGEKILVVDEAYNYQTPQGIPLELQTIVQSGRKRGLSLLLNVIEPNRLNSSITNGASEVICFRLQSAPALETARKTFFLDPEEVAALEPLQFVARNLDSGGELRGKIAL